MAIKGLKAALALAAGSLMALGAAQAQNALNMIADGPGTKDLSDITARGFVPFVPSELKGYLLRSGLTVGEEVVSPDGRRVATVAVAGGQVPIVFVHSDCGLQGCLFMEMVSPVPITSIGLRWSEAEVNAFNQESGFVFLTLEEKGDVAVRHTMPALVGCDAACQESAYGLYFTGLKMTHSYLKTLSQQQLVSAPSFGGAGMGARGEAVFVAALPGRPVMMEVAGGPSAPVIDWSSAMTVGDGTDDALRTAQEAAERLVGTSQGRSVPGFPDLFDAVR